MTKWSRQDVGHAILSVAAVTGVLAVTAIAPNCLHLLNYLPSSRARQHRYYIKNAVRRLIAQGYLIQTKNAQGIPCVRLTKKGVQELDHYKLGTVAIKKPYRWDEKYRVIIFDIKETRRVIRDQLRDWLINLGFVRLQQSVWVHPYECKEIISLLKAHFHIGKDVLYMTVDILENDRWLKEHFDLL